MRLCPRMTVRPTSSAEAGQIYVGPVNWALMIATLLVVLTFRTSDSLAAAYGIAVSGTMLITTILLYRVMLDRWGWPLAVTVLVTGVFGAIDATFLAANTLKIVEGGWLPLAIGGAIVFLMTSWRTGTVELQHQLQTLSVPFESFMATVEDRLIARIPGCAVFLTRVADNTSPVLLQQVEHNRVLHEHVILMTLELKRRPMVPSRKRLEVTELGHGFHRVIVRVGFMQTPDIPKYIKACTRHGLVFCGGKMHYYVPHEVLVRRRTHSRLGMPVWLAFSFMSRNALRLQNYLRLPRNQVIEIGLQIDL
jgi:KUP system potassium uptake protein